MSEEIKKFASDSLGDAATKLYKVELKQGPGIPLVFLHGFLGTHRDWEVVCSYLPPCHCLGIDLPGHGKSPFTEVFDFFPPAPKFHLIGYSMGGRLAMHYAMRYPERIENLLLLSTHPGLTSEEERRKRLQEDAIWVKQLLELPIDEFLRRWYDQPLFRRFNPPFSMRNKQSIHPLASAFLHYSVANQPVLHVEQAIHVVGERDEKFRALHPQAIVMPGAGHALHLEQPKALANLIGELFL